MKVLSGTKAARPDLADNEVYICSDVDEVYIGTEGGAVKFKKTDDKVYIANFNANTDPATLTEIKNDDGLTVAITKSTTGVYVLTCANVTATSLVIITKNNEKGTIHAVPGSGQANITSYDETGSAADVTTGQVYILIPG